MYISTVHCPQYTAAHWHCPGGENRRRSRTADPNREFSASSQRLITMEPTGQQQLHTAAIYVTSASYGRTNKKTCSAGRPADQLENTECYTYREEVGERCNGKQWCKVRASNYVFGNPCYGTYKYLEVEYICYEQKPIPIIRSVVACEESVADIWCESGYISVISATYGRRDHTTCSEGIPEEQTRKTDCAMSKHQVTISRELIHRCDGESECPFFASSSVLGDPCVGTFKYLEVKYVCKSEFMV
uniref:SUEL-type lectin domain-containing protein n=1 Tax=Poecilia mexicana TaxID=48701 RepID=A0A3B3WM65_9TELE